MGRPKKINTELIEADLKTAKQYNKSKDQTIKINAITEALQANRDNKQDEGIVLGTSDFEGRKEAINAKLQDIEVGEKEPEEIASPSEAEKLRLLAQIKAKYLNNDTFLIAPTMAPFSRQEDKEEDYIFPEDKMNAEINELKAKLGAKQNNNSTRMNIEHYKTLKDLEKFWIPFKKHGVLNGLNERELNSLTKVMQEVFDPNYNFDLWCSHCVGEFLKDLYTYFENWEEKQKDLVAEYDTVLKEDKF